MDKTFGSINCIRRSGNYWCYGNAARAMDARFFIHACYYCKFAHVSHAANSRIRDTDVAAATSDLAKNNILLQASTATLAQANQSGQGALRLLQG